jgi:mycothiol synthase
VNIEHRNKTQLEPEFTRAMVEHGNRHRLETRPDDPAHNPEDMIAQMAHLPPILDLEFWTITENNKMSASAMLQILHMDTNQHLAELEMIVEPHLRRQGIGTQLLRLAATHAQQLGRSLLMTSSTDRIAAGEPFLEQYGFTRGLENHTNQLKLLELPNGLLTTWTSNLPADYTLEIWQNHIPETDIAAFAELFKVMNTAPKGELEIEDFSFTPEMIRQKEAMQTAGGIETLTAVVRHKNGELVGLNELSWRKSRTSIVSQGGTGVNPAHRNHGLGRWLKAANVLRLLELNSEAKFIRTGNADSNAPMLKINTEMGFRPYEASIAWQGNIATILEKVGNA